jgi:hypothetical protein
LGEHFGHDLHIRFWLITFRNRFGPQSFHIRLKYHEDKIATCKCLWPTTRWELIMIAIIRGRHMSQDIWQFWNAKVDVRQFDL